MRVYILIFISLIFLMMILVTYMGMNSTVRALEFHSDHDVITPLDEVSSHIRLLYESSSEERDKTSLLQASEALDDARSRLSRREILAQEVYYYLARNLVILFVICICGIVLLWYGLHKLFIAPLNRTFKTMKGAALNNWDVQLEKSGLKEIRNLQDALNKMMKEIRLSQEQIRNMERDNIGRFMAHQIKNSLTPILLCSYNIRELASEEELKENNALVITETEKIQNLIDQFRTLTRFPELNRSRVELNLFLQNMVKPLENVLFNSSTESVSVHIDPLLFEQALLNIVKNGLEASNESHRPVEITMEGGNPPVITIGDKGTGIPQEMLSHITQEDFTTKKKGMGIGLSFVQKVVRAHGFSMQITSELGKGTTVKVVLNG